MSTLPHSVDAEQAVLATVLLEPPALTALAAELQVEDFYLEKHQAIWRAYHAIAETHGPDRIDLRTLEAALQADNTFELVGGFSYLSGLDLALPDLGRMATYAGIVKQHAVTRSLILEQRRTLQDLAKGGRDEQGATALDRALDTLEATTRHARVRLASRKVPRSFARIAQKLSGHKSWHSC